MQQLLDLSKKKIAKVGDVLTGKVLYKEARRIFIDLGVVGTGVVLGREYLNALSTIKNLKNEAEISVKVIGPVNEDGYWELSLSEADKEATWQKLKDLKDKKETLGLVVMGVNYGGLLLQLDSVEGFLPVSQLSLEHYPRVDGGDKAKILDELRKFTGKEIKVRILDIDEKEGKLIFSEKEAQKEAIQQAITNYQLGDIIEGEITGLADFGVFIKFGGEFALEGLIHISEIDYALVDDPGKYVQVGDKVKAKIINIKDDRIFLSLKALKPDPWSLVEQNYKKQETYSGKVIKTNPVGAFVSFSQGIYGICPIALFSNDIERLKNTFKVGQEYLFAVTDIDQQEKRLMLTYNPEPNK
jgi:small subunit ribosomal protein S1